MGRFAPLALRRRRPNFLWSLAYGPFAVFLAGDVGNPAQVVSNVVSRIIPGITTGGTIQVVTNRAAIVWRGLPIVVPIPEQAPAPDRSFLATGLFPIMNDCTNKAPAELFAQLNKKNLVFYEWEITQTRLQQWARSGS